MQDVAPDRTSPTEDGFNDSFAGLTLEARKLQTGQTDEPDGPDYLKLMREAKQRGQTYYTENLQGPIDNNYRAFRNKHFSGSKYWSGEYRNRSKLFRPKTRSAVRKANAAAISALFSSTDAVKCSAGDDSNPLQKANAALTQELFNYRTDRTSGQAAIPWFRICGGAHQDAMLQSACISKQYWKLELRPMGEEPEIDAAGLPVLDENGAPKMVEVYRPFIDRPDVMLFPLENIVIDPAANWLNPIQSAAFFMAKVPMSIDEVMQMQHHPLNPWKALTEAQLRSGASDQAGISARRQREGLDRLDNRFTGTRNFEIVWVYEVFIRLQGEDICFWAAGDQHYLTDPKPVHEVYPEQGGERPYTFGVINLESHRLFPMSPVESWQQGQIEINDFANLTLDVAKLSVAPVTKVKRGQNVDLGALARRGPQSQILVNNVDDVTWDRQPGPDGAAMAIQDRLSVDFDDQAGQFNSGSVQTNRSLNETVGGLRLISGAANAVSEFDLRVWIETWTEPTIGQIVKLLQYYEDDATILALCGGRAKLFEKFGVSEINDELLQAQVKVRVDAGVGNADPEQKLAKLQTGLSILMPLFAGSPQVASGALTVDLKAIADEVFGLCGQRDGADKFIKTGQPAPPPPTAGLAAAKLQSEIDKNQASAKATLMSGLAQIAKVDLGGKKLEAEQANALIDTHLRAVDMGHQHGSALAQPGDGLPAMPMPAEMPAQADGMTLAPEAAAQDAPQVAPGRAVIEALVQALQAPRARRFQFERDADGRLNAVHEVSGGDGPRERHGI
jgi:hypothetical protein